LIFVLIFFLLRYLNFRQKKADRQTIGGLAMRKARIYKLLQQAFARNKFTIEHKLY